MCLRDGAVLRSVCVDVPLVTNGRPIGGRIRIDVEQCSRTSTVGLLERPDERATLVLPWVVLLLGAVAVRGRLRDAARAAVR